MRYTLLSVIVAVFLLVGGAFAQEKKQEAKKDGWWINAGIQKQNPQSMIFYVGSASGSFGFWTVWNPGDPVAFDIPEEYRNAPVLYIKAQTISGVKCQFCVMYKSNGVRQFDIDIEEDHEMKQSEEDKRCK